MQACPTCHMTCKLKQRSSNAAKTIMHTALKEGVLLGCKACPSSLTMKEAYVMHT